MFLVLKCDDKAWDQVSLGHITHSCVPRLGSETIVAGLHMAILQQEAVLSVDRACLCLFWVRYRENSCESAPRPRFACEAMMTELLRQPKTSPTIPHSMQRQMFDEARELDV